MPQTFPAPFEILGGISGVIFQFFASYWWLILPVVLFFILFEVWMIYIKTRWLKAIEWVLLEVRIPKELLKTPKAMEQIFFGLAAIHHTPNMKEKYLDGEVQLWVSCEIFSHEAGVHFYIRTPVKFRSMVESLIYAEYPQAEIAESEDYAKLYQNLPTPDRDIWGTEMILAKPAPYPIRTYEYYEEAKEEKRLDPLAAVLEIMSRLKEGEEIWIQLLVQPQPDRGEKWLKEGREIVDKLIGKKKPATLSISGMVFEFFINLIKSPFEHPTWAGEAPKSEAPESLMQFLSPGQKAVVEAIEKKISLPGFRTSIRWVYHAPKAVFSKARISEILSAFSQFSTNDMNGLKPNSAVSPSIDYWWQFKTSREYFRKQAVFLNYQLRAIPILTAPKNILNVTELATLYHYPIVVVEAPRLHRLEYKKGAPPPTLPVEE